MYHFPSSGGSKLDSAYSSTSGGSGGGGSSTNPRNNGGSGLNATQSRTASNPIFLKIEEELHDARRVRSHGQEEDLRLALDMVIGRVSELSTTLSEAYKAKAELEVQLNVAKSNLQLLIMNNDMLEEALKKNNVAAKDLGWRRTSNNSNLERSQSMDYHIPDSPASAGPASSDKGFFKFRFSGSSPSPAGASASRPGTPSGGHSTNAATAAHLTSPSMPSLTATSHAKELEDLNAELEKERKARQKVVDEKKALEDELESLSQALFEEANKMVAEERMKLAETEEELKETRAEKQALQSALRLLDGQARGLAQYQHQNRLRKTSSEFSLVPHEGDEGYVYPQHEGTLHSRNASVSSSRVGIKSVPTSPITMTSSLPALPPSPFPEEGIKATQSGPGSPSSIRISREAAVLPSEDFPLTATPSTSSTFTSTTSSTSTSTSPPLSRPPSANGFTASPTDVDGFTSIRGSRDLDLNLGLSTPGTEEEEEESHLTPRYHPPALHSVSASSIPHDSSSALQGLSATASLPQPLPDRQKPVVLNILGEEDGVSPWA